MWQKAPFYSMRSGLATGASKLKKSVESKNVVSQQAVAQKAFLCLQHLIINMAAL